MIFIIAPFGCRLVEQRAALRAKMHLPRPENELAPVQLHAPSHHLLRQHHLPINAPPHEAHKSPIQRSIPSLEIHLVSEEGTQQKNSRGSVFPCCASVSAQLSR